MIKLLILILLYSLISANQWENLLHFDDNYTITNNEFYTTASKYPSDELNSSINILNSKNGNNFACNFPARYTYLLKNNYPIKKYNLLKCKNLTNFTNSFKKDKLSIVFSSEYVNSPSSAFGHIMLLFSDNNKNLDIGDSVHYAALTPNNDGFFKYAYNGATGQYNGHFIREPFFKKIYQYNTKEQRYMYIYNLNFTKEEVLFIIYHLYELRKATFKYYFLDENCATQTANLLNIITNYKKEKNILYLPIDIIKLYKKNITNTIKYLPTISKLAILNSKMDKKEKLLFKNIIKTHNDINNNYPNIVKNALVQHTIFEFRRFHRWYKNYDNIMNQSYIEEKLTDTSKNPLEKTQPSNLGIGFIFNKNINSLFIEYRPLFIDLYDLQFNKLQQSEVDILNIKVAINKQASSIISINLLSLKSFPLQSIYYNPPSWALYSGINRKNKNEILKFNNEIGIGRTNNSLNINIHTLLFLGFDNADIYLKPYINLNTNFTSSLKSGLILEYKRYKNNTYFYKSIFTTYKQNDILYKLNIEDSKHLKLYFSINLNF